MGFVTNLVPFRNSLHTVFSTVLWQNKFILLLAGDTDVLQPLLL